jgi:hypothetical protein
MDCSEDIVCQLFDWFSSSGYVVRQVLHGADGLWNAAGGKLTTFFSEHGEKLVAALSFSFAVYRWWIYRERVLHKRLEEYIRESDERLRPTTSRMLEAILKPGRVLALPQPAFALELNDILESSGWRRFFGISPIGWQAERQLKRALKGVRLRERTVAIAARSLQKQRADVHMLRGAIAVSRARSTSDDASIGKHDGHALREFQRALQTETHRHDAEAKECEAFQFLRLGQHGHALGAYEEMEEFAHGEDDARKRDLLIARSKRYQAQITQVSASGGSLAALALIGAGKNPQPESALRLRAKYAPYELWDALEQAEIHYVSAYVANRLGANNIEPQQLALAQAQYGDVLSKLPRRLWFVRRSTRMLRVEAQAGWDRLVLAKIGSYDDAWLGR